MFLEHYTYPTYIRHNHIITRISYIKFVCYKFLQISYKNHENPLLVNILQLADSLDAATDSVGRSYAKTKNLDEILKEFSHERGVRYNATLVNMMQRDANFQEKLNQILTQGREEICYEIYKEYTI